MFRLHIIYSFAQMLVTVEGIQSGNVINSLNPCKHDFSPARYILRVVSRRMTGVRWFASRSSGGQVRPAPPHLTYTPQLLRPLLSQGLCIRPIAALLSSTSSIPSFPFPRARNLVLIVARSLCRALCLNEHIVVDSVAYDSHFTLQIR